mgnify:CR=1 FL=1
MLFSELTGLTYTCNLLLSECRESNDDSFRLRSFQLLYINVAYPFVPYLYVGVESLALSIHGQFNPVRVEDEHMTISPTAHDKSAFFFDEASSIVEANLHALFDYLAN